MGAEEENIFTLKLIATYYGLENTKNENILRKTRIFQDMSYLKENTLVYALDPWYFFELSLSSCMIPLYI